MAPSNAVFSVLSLIFVLFTLSDAKRVTPRRVFQVGGKEHQWKIPSDSNLFDLWAQRTRFHVNNTLNFKYDAKDSVLVVTREDYYNCDGSKPIEKYEDGDTMILLDRSGPFFFISGAEGHCEKGQRLVVVVMSLNHDWRIRPRSFAAPPVPEPSQAPARAADEAGESGGAGGLTGGFGGVVAVGLVLVGMIVF